MTSEDITHMETFLAFCENANTRGGGRFMVDRFVIGSANEGGNRAMGKVYLETGNSGKEIPLEMEWNLSGSALKIGSQFDLIQEESYRF